MEEVFTKSLFWVLPLIIWSMAEVLAMAVKSIDAFTPFLQRVGIFIGCLYLFPTMAIMTGIWVAIIFEALV